MSSDVSHPAGVGFHWKVAVGMSQRLLGGVGAGSKMLSPRISKDIWDGGWMHHVAALHQRPKCNSLFQRQGAATCLFWTYILDFKKYIFAMANQVYGNGNKYIFAEQLGFLLKNAGSRILGSTRHIYSSLCINEHMRAVLVSQTAVSLGLSCRQCKLHLLWPLI